MRTAPTRPEEGRTEGRRTSQSTHLELTFDPSERASPAPARELTQAHYAPFCSVVIKVGMVGDSQIGKTSLMVKYVSPDHQLERMTAAPSSSD